MTIRVLIVDDSRFFLRRVKEILDADPRLSVVASAENGVEAIEKARELKPDVITMDIEMPVMDGITAVRNIMKDSPTPIIMFSSLTTEGAKSTLDALEAGALDFLPKKFEDIAKDRDEAKKLLCDRVVAVSSRSFVKRKSGQESTTGDVATKSALKNVSTQVNTTQQLNGQNISGQIKGLSAEEIKLIAIGTSTGGPIALQQILSRLPENLPVPVIIVQHMPGNFTLAFANRLDSMCAIKVKEASQGDVLEAGSAYLAPGGCQMFIEQSSGQSSHIRITGQDDTQFYNPCVDSTFSSVEKIYPGAVLAIILTGMGADGCAGSKLLKQSGCELWAQDEESCVVFGMPGAVIEAGLVDHVYPVNLIGDMLVRKFQ